MATQDLSGTRTGDKIRIRAGELSGQRGVVVALLDDSLLIELEDQVQAELKSEQVTNYSLAARRAWETMPKRAGRPVLAAPRKKMVSVRLDSQVWESLGKAVEHGLISSREQAINLWLREKVDELFDRSPDDRT